MSPRPIPVLAIGADPQRPIMGDPTVVNPARAAAPAPPADGITGMGSRLLPSAMRQAAPVQQLTPDQRYFRDTVAAGRWQADFDTGANAPLTSMTRHDDGTCDTTALEADGDSWIDLGGRGGRDVSVGRP